MRVHKMVEKLLVKDKGYNPVKGGGSNYSNYLVEGIGLTFKDVPDLDHSCHFMTEWEITTSTETYTGSTVEELLATLESFIALYDLKSYTKLKKDVLVIYTNRLRDLYCYLYNHITNSFLIEKLEKNIGYFQVFNFIELRQCWNKDLKDSKKICYWAYNMFKFSFVPDKFVFLTESSVGRKLIKRYCKKAGCHLGEEIFPDTYTRYNMYKKAAHGGICYCACPGVDFQEPMIEVDLKSAYIYCYTLDMPLSAGEDINPKLWNKVSELTIGKYEITFSNTAGQLSTIKDIDDHNFDCSGDVVTQTFRLTSVDLNTIRKLCDDIKKINCVSLTKFESGRLPKAYIDTLIHFFYMKETTTNGERAVWKIALNGCYGNAIRNLTKQEFKKYNYKELAPQWGAFITSYCRQLVIDLGITIDCWRYSDTDCIFCKDLPSNRKKIENYNKKARAHIKKLCDDYGYDYNVIKDLGSFIIEDEIVRFRAIGNKQYAYKTKSGKVVVKAAGCEKQDHYDDSVFELEVMPIGIKECDYKLVKTPTKSDKYYAETSYSTVVTDKPEVYHKWLELRELIYGKKIEDLLDE